MKELHRIRLKREVISDLISEMRGGCPIDRAMHHLEAQYEEEEKEIVKLQEERGNWIKRNSPRRFSVSYCGVEWTETEDTKAESSIAYENMLSDLISEKETYTEL